MRFTPYALLLLVAVVASGCYHARVETGLTPSAQVIEKGFAHSFIYGLVPPSTVSTTSQCPNGVAMVETQISFVNGLVSSLTGGLYTPMSIKATCAAAGSASAGTSASEVVVSEAASMDEIKEAFSAAADETVETGDPVYVRFE